MGSSSCRTLTNFGPGGFSPGEGHQFCPQDASHPHWTFGFQLVPEIPVGSCSPCFPPAHPFPPCPLTLGFYSRAQTRALHMLITQLQPGRITQLKPVLIPSSVSGHCLPLPTSARKPQQTPVLLEVLSPEMKCCLTSPTQTHNYCVTWSKLLTLSVFQFPVNRDNTNTPLIGQLQGLR